MDFKGGNEHEYKRENPPEEGGPGRKGEKGGYKAPRTPSEDLSPTTRTNGGLS